MGTNVGQAFRVGRYPIHFHIPGNMSTSYVRGNAIHHSNNRACTLHNVMNLLVEKNVAYSIKGLTFFLEDGIEEYNILQYNLAMFTRMSNFNSAMGTVTCKGCPDGMTGRKKRDTSSQPLDLDL